jgi:hypothetical protein
MAKRKHTKVVYKDLRAYWGLADLNTNTIELNKRLKGKKHLEIIIHEKLHLLLQSYDEMAIKNMARELMGVLWSDGYRKIK